VAFDPWRAHFSRRCSRTGANSLLAEMGTVQLEFRQLSHYTGDGKYAGAADRISHMLESSSAMHHGLWNTYLDRRSGRSAGVSSRFVS
jgi:hypothetical protein